MSRLLRPLTTTGARFTTLLLAYAVSVPPCLFLSSRPVRALPHPRAKAVTREPPQADRVKLSRVQLQLGATRENIASLTGLCARESLPDECLGFIARGTAERSLHILPSFWIDRTETTRRAYAECARLGSCPDDAAFW